MSWYAEIRASWNAEYDSFARGTVSFPDELMITGKTLRLLREACLLEALSLRPRELALSFTRDAWLASDPSAMLNPATLTGTQRRRNTSLPDYRFTLLLSFSGITGEASYALYDSREKILEGELHDVGSPVRRPVDSRPFWLPSLARPDLLPSVESASHVSVDMLSMQMLSAFVGVDLLRAEDDLLPVIGVYR